MSILRKENNDINQLNFMSIQLDDDEKYFWTNQITFTPEGFIDFCKRQLKELLQNETENSKLQLFFVEDLESEAKCIYDLKEDYVVIFESEIKIYHEICERELNFIHWHNYAKELKCDYKHRQVSIPDLNNFTGFDV